MNSVIATAIAPAFEAKGSPSNPKIDWSKKEPITILPPSQRREKLILCEAEVLMQEDPNRFDSVVRKLLTMLSRNTYDVAAPGKRLRPFGLAEGKVKIPEEYFERLSEDEISLFEGE